MGEVELNSVSVLSWLTEELQKLRFVAAAHSEQTGPFKRPELNQTVPD